MNVSTLERAESLASTDQPTRDLIVGRRHSESDSEERFAFGEIPIHREVGNELQELVADSIALELENIREGRRELEPYEITNMNRDDPPIQYLTMSEFPFADSVSPLIEGAEFPETTYERPRPDLQAIRLDRGEGTPLIGFREYTNRQVVRPNNKIRVLLEGNEYSRFDRELVTLPAKIDAIFFDGEFAIFEQRPFEDSIDYLEHFRDLSETVLDDIESSSIHIDNMSKFREWVTNDKRKIRKMCQISELGIVDDLDMDQADEIIDVHDLGIDIVTDDNGTRSLSIQNGNKAWDMIKLLNNDHLRSPVNSENIQVTGGKRRAP